MKLICSKCDTPLLTEDMNITTDLGKCNKCGAVLKLSELSEVAEVAEKIEVTSTPPIGSLIVVDASNEDELVFTLPKQGISSTQIPTLVFGIFWVGFVAFWTFLAAQGTVFFSLFSIPFWFVGLSMLYGVLIGSQESQKITITSETIKLAFNRPLFSSNFEANIKDIQEISISNLRNIPKNILGNYNVAKYSQKKRSNKVPTIISYANSTSFFENATKEDQIWITALLNKIVKEMS